MNQQQWAKTRQYVSYLESCDEPGHGLRYSDGSEIELLARVDESGQRITEYMVTVHNQSDLYETLETAEQRLWQTAARVSYSRYFITGQTDIKYTSMTDDGETESCRIKITRIYWTAGFTEEEWENFAGELYSTTRMIPPEMFPPDLDDLIDHEHVKMDIMTIEPRLGKSQH